MRKHLIILALAWVGLSSALAQTKPVFRNYEFADQSIIQAMSDNGKWAVSSSNKEGVANTHLINLDTQDTLTLSSSAATEYGTDITNDGTLVVGHVAGKPAICNTQTGKWTKLPVKSPYTSGTVMAVTPDGKTAVGNLYYGDGYYSIPAIWNLTETGGTLDESIYSNAGLPTQDMSHQDQGMMDFRAIGADGRYVLGCMSYSYLPTSLDLGGCFYFVYDRTGKTYKPVGFTETKSGPWTPHADGMNVIMSATMSNNGLYVTGDAHVARDIEGSEFANEYDIPFLYDVTKDEFTAYDELSAQETYGTAVTNEGVVLSASPVGTPVREWSVRYSKYWFTLSEILKQKYGTTFAAATNLDNTGTVNSISDDGCRLACFPDPYTSYVVDLPVPVKDLGEGVKLLGSYQVSPVAGSEVSHLKKVTVTFDRAIVAVGNSKSAEIRDSEGNTVYSSVGFSAEGKTLSIRFRTGTLQEGKNYTLYIPEGAIVVAEDATQTNGNIEVAYKGRRDQAVELVKVYPEEGTAFSRIDYSTSPVMLTFDTYVALTDSATAWLYRNDEAEPYCQLTLAYSDCRVSLYPATSQYLFDGSTYRIEVEAGSVTDVAGNNPNAPITIHYIGNYVREISSDDVLLFSDNFDKGLSNWMQWCGDHRTPSQQMQDWDFTTGMAWGLVLESAESTDLIAASHSMYSTPGTSDDWLVTPQIYLPDRFCNLKFICQGYKKDKQDVLKVVIWESNNVYNTLTEDIIDRMKTEGDIIVNDIITPGATEEGLSGEWTQGDVSLADYAGKNVYIAFVNNNSDQSALFLDNVEVRHDMDFLTVLNYEESVVNQSEADITVTVIGNSDTKTYEEVTVVLENAAGEVIGTGGASNIHLSKGVQKKLSFEKPLPLTVGVANEFTVHVYLDDEKNEVKGTIKNLAFNPTKRIVLEEYTGRACGNCPLGILGMEKLEARYGEQFLPISIHTYNNDPLGSGLSNYTSLLGIDQLGAPSGMINRMAGCYPATSAEVNDVPRFFFTNTDPDLPEATDKLWMDYADEAMQTPVDCGIEIVSLPLDENTQTLQANCEVRYALNAQNQTVNLFAVLVEDNISQAQSNYMNSTSSPDLGEWGLGGRYGQSVVTDYLHQDVCRNVVGLTINGTGGYIPATVTAGTVYKASIDIPVPSTVQSLSQCKAIVMMIDANTGLVINAARAKYTGQTHDAVEDITVQTEDKTTYNLAGQRVSTNYRGLIIRGGKKYLNK